MRYLHLALAAWLFVLGFSLMPAGAVASDKEGLRLDIDTLLPGIEQFGRGEELPNYWNNWTRESASARSAGVHLRNRTGVTVEGLERIEPRMMRLEEKQAKELTLSDVALGTLKFVGFVIAIPIVLTGYVGLFFLESSIEAGESYGFG